jgi:hypothetical protein
MHRILPALNHDNNYYNTDHQSDNHIDQHYDIDYDDNPENNNVNQRYNIDYDYHTRKHDDVDDTHGCRIRVFWHIGRGVDNSAAVSVSAGQEKALGPFFFLFFFSLEAQSIRI